MITTPLTPAMKQYYDIKNEYSDSVIFFRMWDFYEMFWEDAKIAHKVLWINITSRNKNSSNPELLAWLPYHAKDKYLPMLIKAWYKVAIVEQVWDPKLKWIVKREVVRVVTPATIFLEWDMYDDVNQSNIIISITKNDKKYWLSILDIFTSKWEVWEFDSFEKLKEILYTIQAVEIILDKEIYSKSDEIKDILSKKFNLNIYYFSLFEDPKVVLINHFQTKNLSWFWLSNFDIWLKSRAILLIYLKLNQKDSFSLLKSISVLNYKDFLFLDESTIKNLDIVYNYAIWSFNEWTLFGILNHTQTSMWKRLLRQNLLFPLRDKFQIEQRLDFVEEFYKNRVLLINIREKLSLISDIDAILNRLSIKRVTPRDLLSLKKSLQSLVDIIEYLQINWTEKIKNLINI